MLRNSPPPRPVVNTNLPPADIAGVCAAHGIHLDESTLAKLARYDALLLKWQKAINLVGPTTLEDRANRHFLDSIQLIKHLPDTSLTLMDIGSGAGFPGLVLAMLGVKHVHLVESDIRKATFLREVSRETILPVTIHDRRVEDVTVPGVGVLTARALAPLTDLLGYMHQLEVPTGLFLKGAQADEEIEKALKKWDFKAETLSSLTETEAKIVRVTHLQPRETP